MDPLTLISLLAPLVKEGIKAWGEARRALQQSGEWTVEQEAEWNLMLAKAKMEPHWQPDKE